MLNSVAHSSLWLVRACLCLVVVGIECHAFHVLNPYIPQRGPFPNHYPAGMPTGHRRQSFVGYPSHVPFVRHPSGFSNTSKVSVFPQWWPRKDGIINIGGIRIRVDTTVDGKPSSGSTSRQCWSTCGSPKAQSLFGYRQWDYSHFSRRPVNVWRESTSEFSPVRTYVEERGTLNTLDYEMYFRNDDGPISPFHDIPLFANENNKIFNMVVEVPRWTNAKMEIATKDPLNPIKQDVKKGKLRYVANVFPHHGYIWNYGALPQTWEDPNHCDDATGCKGDNDPIDVCEIGYRVAKRGDVLQVKILGTLALIDEGETDWKLIAIDVNDPLAPQLSDISDVEKHMPGFLKATVEWFKIYKIPDGKPENQFAFEGMAKDRDFAHKVILETHEAWQNLVEGKTDAGGIENTCVRIPQAVKKMSVADAEQAVSSAPEPSPAVPLDPKIDLWHYVSLK